MSDRARFKATSAQEAGEGTAASTMRFPLMIFLGALLMQAAWVVAVPPFRGIDEFDHAFKAAAVAGGQWRPSGVAAANGRGELVAVPADLVSAARPVCESYAYTGPDNCRPVDRVNDSTVLIATAASRYSPAYYWAASTPAALFEGVTFLYALRLVSAVACAGYIALAAWAITLSARTRWPMVGLLLAVSPVAVYSTSIAAPNGAEVCAALSVWTILLALAGGRVPTRTEKWLILAALPGVIALVTLRQLGPLFLLLMVGIASVFMGRRRLAQVATIHRKPLALTALCALAGSIAHVHWILTNNSLALEPEDVPNLNPFEVALSQVPLWTFQSIAAFPTWNDRAPAVVYACWFVIGAGLVTLAVAKTNLRLRLVLLITVLTVIAVPIVLTTVTFSTTGVIWQGRYGLPLALGIPLLAGAFLDMQGCEHRLEKAAISSGAVALVAAHVASVTHVLGTELRNSPLSGDPAWFALPPWAVAALMSAGAVLWCVATFLQPARRSRPCA